MVEISLAADSSAPVHSVAILRGEDCIYTESFLRDRRDDGGLLGAVDRGLKSVGLNKHDLSRLVVGRGPGAFTGLRVSMALLKSLAFSLGLPLYGVSSLEALGYGVCLDSGVVCASLDARRGEVYVGFYHRDGDQFKVLGEEILVDPQKLAGIIREKFSDVRVYMCGTGAVAYREHYLGIGGVEILEEELYPKASILGLLGLNASSTSSLSSLEPKYLRIEHFAEAKSLEF